ncbi:MAG: hypothetical protein RL095_369 [Verrucomicrobiota bacterium]
MFQDYYRGKSVFLTGHTGFKGSWLCQWLLLQGATVHGFSLPPPTQPSLFDLLELGTQLASDVRGDVQNLTSLTSALKAAQPDIAFHLAAQPLVRASYQDPAGTYASNVMGTVNFLEALRLSGRPCAAVVVTTDKCYENREWLHPYRETDPLGGHDPYSASKACAEIVTASYRSSFAARTNLAIATARAGNVIGGGDFAEDRILPDLYRATQTGKPLEIRSPRATRPWQHVLDPLSGYLLLGKKLHQNLSLPVTDPHRRKLESAFNFGPGVRSNRSVHDLLCEVRKTWPIEWREPDQAPEWHEAQLLDLSIEKAHHLLGWSPRWDFAETVRRTAAVYLAMMEPEANVADLLRQDLAEFTGIPLP